MKFLLTVSKNMTSDQTQVAQIVRMPPYTRRSGTSGTRNYSCDNAARAVKIKDLLSWRNRVNRIDDREITDRYNAVTCLNSPYAHSMYIRRTPKRTILLLWYSRRAIRTWIKKKNWNKKIIIMTIIFTFVVLLTSARANRARYFPPRATGYPEETYLVAQRARPGGLKSEAVM